MILICSSYWWMWSQLPVCFYLNGLGFKFLDLYLSLWEEVMNNIDKELGATMTVLLTVSISSTCFGQLFTHLQERWTVFCSLRYNVPKLSTQSSNILHTDHISRSLHPGYRPTKTLVPYISNCKTQSSVPEDGQIIARNMLSWLKLLIKLSLLHLVLYRYYS